MAVKRKIINSVLVKPSGPDCNLNCEYCFYLDKSELFEGKRHRMSTETQEELIRQLMDQSASQLSVAWQGGEPTLMGLDFYRNAIELYKKYGKNKSVSNSIQTNGILLTTEWAKFLKEYNFLVGLSLDGPKHIHDHYRKMKNGKGSWTKVSQTAKMLIEQGVEVNTLSCVTDYSSKYAREIYAFLHQLGVSWMQFIPIIERNKTNPNLTANFSVSGDDYGNFLKEIFNLWAKDYQEGKNPTSVRHIESIFYRYVGFSSPECTLMKECGIYLLIEHNGDVFACDFFVEPEWKLGNIHKDKLIEMLNSEKMDQFGKRKSKLPDYCTHCKWLEYCFGGCIKDRIRAPEDLGHNHFCESYQIFLNHADPILRQMANAWHKQQSHKNITYNANDHFK